MKNFKDSHQLPHYLSPIQLLKSLNSIEELQALNSIGVFSIRDLSEYKPCRYAQILIGSIENDNIEHINLNEYLNESVVQDIISNNDRIGVKNLSTTSLIDFGTTSSEIFKSHFSIETIGELASFNAFLEARLIIEDKIADKFYEKPSAPSELIPKIIGSTHTVARFSNYVKENAQVLEGTSVVFYADSDEPRAAKELQAIFKRSQFKFHFGYLASFKQRWINVGTHLGEIVHSLALAPGESRNIAFIEWKKKQTSSRQEDTEATEVLESEFFQHRALNEVVKATAQEHLYGETEIDATTKTTGYGITAGVGGGASSGASGKADLTSVVGLPLQVAGAGLGAIAGSLGGSLVHSKGTTQGTLKSETTGERTITGEVMQDISDSTVQNSSNIRSLMSTVVIDDDQSGSQKTYTRNVTNYNHSHALTISYYEVLQKYNTNTFCDGITPVLYLPFKPINFDIELIKKYWSVLKRPVKQSVTRIKFKKYNATVRDFKAENGMFDSSGDVRITKVKIITGFRFSSGVRIEINDASPDVTLKIKQSDMDECLTLKIEGSSTYIDYKLFEDLTLIKSNFNGQDSFEIDENIKGILKSTFKSELKKQMKRYLGDSDLTPKVWETNREDNELGQGNNRNNLIQNVDDNNFRILNGNETVDFDINIEFLLEDIAGNEETVQQTYSDSLTFSNLYNGYDETIFNVTDHINNQLTDISDINSADQVEELESYFQTYKYSFTKYLLSYIEKEQVIDIIDHLALDSASSTIPLSSIIDPNPLGIVENLMIFKLIEPDSTSNYKFGDKFSFVAKHKSSDLNEDEPLVGSGMKMEIIKGGLKHTNYQIVSENRTGILNPTIRENKPIYEYDITISDEPNENGKYEYFGKVTTKSIHKGITKSDIKEISGETKKPGLKNLKLDYVVSTDGSKSISNNKSLNVTFDGKLDYKPSKDKSINKIIKNYLNELNLFEKSLKKKFIKDNVFLPTSGVFAEAILGISNASEYINISRFYNWQDSPIPNSAPLIAAVNANQDYSDSISDQLQPNVPVNVLNQISPQQMPASSLNTALGAIQNGAMFNDMSKTDQFVSALSDLATLANNTAQLAGTLSGEAAENALNAAVELGKQVAGMVNTAMGTNIASPPSNPTTKGGAKNAMEEMKTNPDGTVSPVDNAIAGGLGTPVKDPCNKTPDPKAPTPTPDVPDPDIPDSEDITSVESKLFLKLAESAYTLPDATTLSELILGGRGRLGDMLSLLLPNVLEATPIVEIGTELLVRTLNSFHLGGYMILQGDLSSIGNSSVSQNFFLKGDVNAIHLTTGSLDPSPKIPIESLVKDIKLSDFDKTQFEYMLGYGDLTGNYQLIQDAIDLITDVKEALNSIETLLADWTPAKVSEAIIWLSIIENWLNETLNFFRNQFQYSGFYFRIIGVTDWIYQGALDSNDGSGLYWNIQSLTLQNQSLGTAELSLA